MIQFKFKKDKDKLELKEFIRVISELTNDSTHFIYRQAKKNIKNKVITKDSLLSFLEDILSKCHGLRDKKRLYFLLVYFLFRFHSFKDGSLKDILVIKPLVKSKELETFISSSSTIKYKDFLLKDFENSVNQYNILFIKEEDILSKLEEQLKVTKEYIEVIKQLCN